MSRLLGIAGGSALLYAGISVLIAVIPGIFLSRVPPGPGVKPLTPLEARGRDVYVSQGCAYCHTQQVRPLPMDSVFGRPTAPGDLAYQTPELLSGHRNGPDLTNIGNRQPSDVWQYMHLYEPRAVVPQSIMPSFRFLFRVVEQAPPGVAPVPLPKAFAPPSGVVIPRRAAKALVAYLLSLKQPPLPGAKTAAISPPPAAPTAGGFNAAEGATLFAGTCAACHGATGTGVPGAFPPLAGDPVVNAEDPSEQIATVLHGAHGRVIGGKTYAAAMPPFATQFSDLQIMEIINHERSSWGNHGKLITTSEVAAVRSGKALPATKAAVSPPPAAAAPAAFNAAEGAKLFAGTCAACHGATGTGVPGAFPPLTGDPVVNAEDPSEQIATVLHGAHGRVIGGKTYAAAMPPFATQFSDLQVMEIINHERSSWGNHGKLITTSEVAAVRAGKALPATKAAVRPPPAAAAPAAFNAAEGAKLFASTCAACHGAEGKGVPGAFPPLTGDPVVNAEDPTEQIATVLHGAHGRVIGGKTYATAMPPFTALLSDLQVMEIINHERSSWGNHGKLITTSEVAAVRAGK